MNSKNQTTISPYCHIVAASTNNVIGAKNKLPWHIQEDLQFFRKKTSQRTVIMGRKTFESLGKPLPHRLNIIISKQVTSSLHPQNCPVFSSIKEALEEAQKISQGEEIFIIGGGEIYKQSIHLVQKIYMTRIHQNYDGDAFYPEIPMNQFKLTERIDREGQPSYSFLIYKKI